MAPPPEPSDHPSTHSPDPSASGLTGRLLVAVPGVLEDPNFRRTVVLVLDHGPHGALGVVLNRPTDLEVTDQFPGWGDVTPAPSVMFAGGPVSTGAFIALGRRLTGAPGADGWNTVLDEGGAELGTVDVSRPHHELGTAIEALRVFVGYAGWRADQLEGEIEVGAWFVVDPEPADAFSAAPDGLWRAVLRRQRTRVALFANFPEDLRAN